MYLYVQYEPRGRETWNMVEANKPLPRPSSFQTVLQISGDPEAFSSQGIDPASRVRYFGPMYFDLDSEDINDVIIQAKNLSKDLKKEGISEDAVSYYLSGKKGLHITINPIVFGLTKPVVALPLVWKYFAEKFWDKYPAIDQSVYSLGKGRMWRSCGMERPDNGKYKVQITSDELSRLDEEMYGQLVSYPRPEFQQNTELAPVPQLVSFREAAELRAKTEIKQRSEAANTAVSVEVLRNSEGIPGCIEKLITEGDCETSTWNQAAMQLAGYIAARYTDDEKDEYEEELITPFLENVESTTRPTRGERSKALTDLIRRAFGGSIRFSVGGIISAIGESCGQCVVCGKPEGNLVHSDSDYYHPEARIRVTPHRVYAVENTGDRPIILSGFTIKSYEVEYFEETKRERVVSTRLTFTSDVYDDSEIDVPETEWVDERQFRKTLSEGSVQFVGNMKDLQNLYTTVMRMRMNSERELRTEKAGLVLYEKDGKVFPHYVGRSESFRIGGLPSDMKYTGPPHLAPEVHKLPDITTEEDLKKSLSAIKHMFLMNEEHLMALAVGWMCATTIKPYITENGKRGFPLLNICGSSHTGKSSTAYLLLALGGFPYRRIPIWNAETGTPYPLEEMVVTSSSVVRVIEEANEHTAGRNWDRLLGILKASWDAAGITRGTLKNKGVSTITRSNPAPIMYLSEQPPTVQSIRTRGVEVLLKTTSITTPEYKKSFHIVNSNTKHLEMFGKVLIQASLTYSYEKITEWVEEIEEMLFNHFSGRTLDSYVTVAVGLKFLKETVAQYSEELAEFIKERTDNLLVYLTGSASAQNLRLGITALDDIINTLDQMALERTQESHGLMEGTHYWKEGDTIYLDIRSVFPRYRRYARGQGIEGSIKSTNQMADLLRGETYFAGEYTHPARPGQILHALSETELRKKGIVLSHLRESPLTE